MPAERKPVLIVGGGIGGVAAALALGRAGYGVQLLEQSQEIAPIGYGVQLGPNVLPVLDTLGVGELARKASYLPDAIELYDAQDGSRLGRIPLQGADFDRYYRYPYLAIHRVDLHQILLNACAQYPEIEMVEASTVTRFEQDASGVRAFCKDGREFIGQALIACDGMRSRIREQLFPEDKPRDIGYFAHRRIVPWEQAPQSLRTRGVTMHTSPRLHVIYYPLRGSTELNMVAVFGPTPDADQPYADQIRAAAARGRQEVHDVIGLMDLERRWPIADRKPLRQWGEGRVFLLGDSAHATIQSMAQGAAMALEDVVVLERCIREADGAWEKAFPEFNRLRLTRTARVQLQSRALWHDYHCDGIDAAVRSAEWKDRSEDDFLRCVRWIWTPTVR
jgi:salicylate hydroxylase